jgi:hypothetical protein
VAEFTPEDQMSDDPTNWWAPNDAALVGLARSAGFSKIEVVQGAPSASAPPAPPARPRLGRRPAPAAPIDGSTKIQRYRAVVHAWA